jgi:predicted small secreted protein
MDMTKIIAVTLTIAFLFLSGCNTMQGAGKDIQRAGEKIENSAEKAKQ